MPVGLMMMALGAYRFGLQAGAYDELTRSAGYRWEKVNRIGRAPALQYAGPDSETLSLQGVIYPAFKGGLRQVELMRAQAGKGRALMMTDGLGFVWDRWVIEQVEEKKTYLMSDGAPRKIEFSLSLKSYGADRGGATSLLGALF
ncbi:phage tail protein [Epibacterium ulvae]|uniref:phage tail protein n=1 Tax=Epibacterium ulvae TaxID=1156985 RepID=UPI00248F7519|nr:phage tail protein [Epibacterium ulvae]